MPAELSHVIGLSSEYNNILCSFIQNDITSIITTVGKTIIIQNMDDPHDQHLLTGHDSCVCILAAAKNNLYFASGQLGSKKYKDVSPVLLWNCQTLNTIRSLEGLHSEIVHLSFSNDSTKLLGVDITGRLYLWKVKTGAIITSIRIKNPCLSLVWLENNDPDCEATFCMGIGGNIERWDIMFNLMTNQYKCERMVMKKGPKNFGTRNFCTLDISNCQNYLFAGTTTGELFIFSLPNLIFKNKFELCGGGVRDLITYQKYLLLGSGDGKISCYNYDNKGFISSLWDNKISSSSIVKFIQPSNNKHFITLTKDSKLTKFLWSSSIPKGNLIIEAESDKIKDMCYFDQCCDYIITVTDSGVITVWSLQNYSLVGRLVTKLDANCVHGRIISNQYYIFVGFSNGGYYVYKYNLNDYQIIKMWNVPNAHRGGVTSITTNETSIISGGKDGMIRFWSLTGPTLQFQPSNHLHSSSINEILVDCEQTHVFHSCGNDKNIISYNIKKQRVQDRKSLKNGEFRCISQRKQKYYEIFSVSSDGRIFAWDCDYKDPVKKSIDKYNCGLNSVSVSPDGNYVLLGGNSTMITILQTEKMEVESEMQGHSCTINRIRWTPDGKQFISVGNDMSICIWNWYSPEELAGLEQ